MFAENTSTYAGSQSHSQRLLRRLLCNLGCISILLVVILSQPQPSWAFGVFVRFGNGAIVACPQEDAVGFVNEGDAEIVGQVPPDYAICPYEYDGYPVYYPSCYVYGGYYPSAFNLWLGGGGYAHRGWYGGRWNGNRGYAGNFNGYRGGYTGAYRGAYVNGNRGGGFAAGNHFNNGFRSSGFSAGNRGGGFHASSFHGGGGSRGGGFHGGGGSHGGGGRGGRR